MRFRAIVFLLILSLSLIISASAQIPANKLFAYSNGDLWTWYTGGTPQQITTWGYNGGPILSPDERYVAYLSLSTEGLDEIMAGQAYPFMGTPPTNIWIMDTATLLAERIAIQDSYPTMRGIPAWSPSGRELAWIEYVSGAQTGNMRLVVYDLATHETRIVNNNLNMGFQDAGIYVPPVQWGASAISRLLFTFSEEGKLLFILETHDPETGALGQYLLAIEGDMSTITNEVPIDYVWVRHQGQDMIAVLTRAGDWYLLDLQDGNQYALNRAPALTNDSAAALSPVWTQVGDSWEIHWQAYEGQIVIDLPLVNYSISQGAPTIAPDGSAVAWNNNGDLGYQAFGSPNPTIFLDSPESSGFVQPSNIVWSYTRWTTKADTGAPRPTPVLGGGNACNVSSRLQIGDTVTVTAGPANNVRSDASLSATIVAQFPAGILARVSDGPVCIDGYRWWYVEAESFEGWTAEGNASEYWLEPR